MKARWVALTAGCVSSLVSTGSTRVQPGTGNPQCGHRGGENEYGDGSSSPLRVHPCECRAVRDAAGCIFWRRGMLRHARRDRSTRRTRARQGIDILLLACHGRRSRARKRGLSMVSRIVIVGAVIAAMLLWSGPFSIPDWAVVALLVVMVPLAIVLSVKRMRVEGRLARTLWHALTRK